MTDEHNHYGAEKEYLIGIALGTISVLCNVAGFIILYVVKSKNLLQASQRHLLLYLSAVKGIYCALGVVKYISFVNEYTDKPIINYLYVVRGNCFFIFSILLTVLLAVDRVLSVRYPVKYLAVWSFQKLNRMIFTTFIMSLLPTIYVICVTRSLDDSFHVTHQYVVPVVDFLFVFVIISTHTYILCFVILRRNGHQVHILCNKKSLLPYDKNKPTNSNTNSNLTKESHHAQNTDTKIRAVDAPDSIKVTKSCSDLKSPVKKRQNVTRRIIRKGLQIPCLLIMSFTFFVLIPDQIQFWYYVCGKDVQWKLSIIFNIIHPVSFINDVFIYTLAMGHIRRYLKQKLWKRSSRLRWK